MEPATARITGWHTDMPLFKFPVNWNGFSFNTLQLADRALFQVGRQAFFLCLRCCISISGQVGQCVLEHGGQHGGESDFISRLCDSWDCLRVLCDNCRIAWYRQALAPTDLLWPGCAFP